MTSKVTCLNIWLIFRGKGTMEDSDEHAYDKAQYPILLKQYYMRLFPYEKYYQWLSYSEGKYDEQA